MSAPFHIFDTDSEPGSWAEYIAHWCPRSLRVETFQHFDDAVDGSPECDRFTTARPVVRSFHNGENSDV